MYEVPASPDGRVGCRDALAITRMAFGIVVPPLVLITAVALLAMAAIITFTFSPPWALIPLALLVLVIALFVRWGRSRPGGGAPREL